MEGTEAGHLKPRQRITHSAFLIADGKYPCAYSEQLLGRRVPLLIQCKPKRAQCCCLGFISMLACIRDLDVEGIKLDLQSTENQVLPSDLLVRCRQLLSSLLHFAAC